MDQSLRNSIINIFNEEQNQMDGALDNQSDVSAPDTITEISVTQNSDGTWSKNEKTRKTDFFDGSVDKKNRDKINKKAEDLQAFCREIDNKMLDFNAQIDAKKQQLVSLTAQAKTGNCWVGTAHSLSVGGISKYFGTDIAFNGEVENIKIYPKMAGPQQDNNAKNVFEPDTIYPLTQEYTGYGYKNLPEKIVYKNKDGVGTGSSIDGSGSYLGPVKFDISKTQSDHNARSFSSVGVGTTSLWTWYYDGASSPATCVSIANSIDNIYNEIIALRKERDSLRGDLNILKDKKMEKELASWGMGRVASEVKERKTANVAAINSINKFNNDVTVSDKSLVLYLDAGDVDSYSGSGTSWYDLSANGATATLVNGPTYDYANGGSILFDGVNDYVDFTASGLTTIATIEMWVKLGANYADVNGGNGGMLIGWNTYNVWTYQGDLAYNTSANDKYGISSSTVNALGLVNNWKHYVFEMRSDVSYTNNKIYINGVLQTLSQQLNSENSTNRNFNNGVGRIAARVTSPNYNMPMNCALFKVYNRALTQDEVTQNFNNTKGRFNISDSSFSSDTTLGTSSSNPASSAVTILKYNPNATSGLYWIKPNGYNSAFQVYCDMTTAGGGWMHVGTISDNNEAYNNSTNHPWAAPLNPAQDTGIWQNSTTLGTQSFTADFKSLAWNVCPFTQFLIKDQGDTQRNLLYTNSGQISVNNGSSFASFWGSLSWGAQGSDLSNNAYTNGRVRGVSITNFGVSDPVLDSGNKSILLLKFGEYDTAQDGNKDRSMISWQRYNSADNVDSPGGLGCFTNLGGNQTYRDIVPVVNQADSVVNSITGAPLNYTLWVR